MQHRQTSRAGDLYNHWVAVTCCLAFFALGCTATRVGVSPLGPSSDVATVVFLVGDAGGVKEGDPVLDYLRADVRRWDAAGAAVVVAYLGDNVYPRGLRRDTVPGFHSDTSYLNAQMRVVRSTDASAIFLPGNHDWDKSGPDGVNSVQRQSRYIERSAGPGLEAVFLPEAGCPGPEYRDFARVRLVMIDSEWWLFPHPKRQGCTNPTPRAVAAALVRLLDSAQDRAVIVLSHHPLETHGPHGGYAPPDRTWVFGLRHAFDWGAYVPIPLVGALVGALIGGDVGAAAIGAGIGLAAGWSYPVGRYTILAYDQDLVGPAYRAMVDDLSQAFRYARTGPLVFAGGHDHTLQVIKGGAYGVGHVLVSGAATKANPVASADSTLLAASERGYMRLEFNRDESVTLSVLQFGADGTENPLAWCHVLRSPVHTPGDCRR